MSRNKDKSPCVQKPFPLLKLPAEIRIRIWKYVVVNNMMIFVCNYVGNSRLRDWFAAAHAVKVHREVDEQRRSSWVAVAFTCRQLYLEVTPIYYRENILTQMITKHSKGLQLRLDQEIPALSLRLVSMRLASPLTDI